MASTSAAQGPQADSRPFYCHQCTHQWIRTSNSQLECPSCGQGFIEEVTDDFQPNRLDNPIDMLPRSPLLNFFFYQNDIDVDHHPEANSRQLRRSRLSSDAGGVRSGQSSSASSNQRQASRSRSPHLALLLETGNSRNSVRIGINTLASRTATSRFLSVAIDDIMDSIFAPGGPRPPAMTDEQLEEIPKVPITEEQVANELMCSVCFDDFQTSEIEARKLQCDHIFHEKCIFPWLKTNASCPVCRTALSNATQPEENNDDEEFASLIRVISEYQRTRNGPSTSRARQNNGASTSRTRQTRQSRRITSSSEDEPQVMNASVPDSPRPSRNLRTSRERSSGFRSSRRSSEAPSERILQRSQRRTSNVLTRAARVSQNLFQPTPTVPTLTLDDPIISSTSSSSSSSRSQAPENFSSDNYRTARVVRTAARTRVAEQTPDQSSSSSRPATTADAASGSFQTNHRISRRRNAIYLDNSPYSQIPRPVRAARMNPTVMANNDAVVSERTVRRLDSPLPSPFRFRVPLREDVDEPRRTRNSRRQLDIVFHNEFNQ